MRQVRGAAGLVEAPLPGAAAPLTSTIRRWLSVFAREGGVGPDDAVAALPSLLARLDHANATGG